MPSNLSQLSKQDLIAQIEDQMVEIDGLYANLEYFLNQLDEMKERITDLLKARMGDIQ